MRDMNFKAMKGAAALGEMLECIGASLPSGDPLGDHAVAKILCDYEMELRELLDFAARTCFVEVVS